MAKKQTRQPSPRQRLLAAAEALFYRRGLHSTGIEVVGERPGVAEGSRYYIFGGKNELIDAYLRRQHSAWLARVDAALAGLTDPEDKILAHFDAIVDYASLPEYRGCASADTDGRMNPLRTSY